MSLIARGEWPMIPLLICSLVAITVIVERLLVLIPLRRRTRDLADRVGDVLRDGSVDRAEGLCRDDDQPLARILTAGFRRAGAPPETVHDAFREAAAVELPPLHARLWLLAALAQVSTLLGLLGTVVGMIRAFYAVEARSLGGHLVGPADLAGGLWVALLATAAGLMIAVPSYFAFYALGGMVNAVTSRMERCAHDVGEALFRRRGAPARPARGGTA
jgi:biopolymer transport protein ExbB